MEKIGPPRAPPNVIQDGQPLEIMVTDTSSVTLDDKDNIIIYGLRWEDKDHHPSTVGVLVSFRPYFYVMHPPELPDDDEEIQKVVASAIKRRLGGPSIIAAVSPVRKMPLVGYRTTPSLLYKLDFQRSSFIRDAREAILRGLPLAPGMPELPRKAFEADQLYLHRMQTDLRFGGFTWIRIERPRPRMGSHMRLTVCTEEYVAEAKNITALPERSDVPPLRILSFDIETSTLDPTDPKAKCIQICSVLDEYNPTTGENRTMAKIAQTVGKTAPDWSWYEGGIHADAMVYNHSNERQLLTAFQSMLRYVDPDVLTVSSSISSRSVSETTPRAYRPS